MNGVQVTQLVVLRKGKGPRGGGCSEVHGTLDAAPLLILLSPPSSGPPSPSPAPPSSPLRSPWHS